MTSRLVQMFTLVLVGLAVPAVQAGTVTFTYTDPDASSALAFSGFGSFSYNGSLATIGKSDLTSFAFHLDLTASGAIPPTATFDWALADLLTFSASVSGGVVTSLSLTTDTQAATNTSNFNEDQKSLIVTNLNPNGAAIDNTNLFNQVTVSDTGTITTLGPGAQAPEPSAALLCGAGLLLALGRRTLRARRG